MENFYNFLGLDIDASTEEIKKAYRKLSLKFHPDKNDGDKFFEDRFKQINKAYETLSNPAKKATYDKKLSDYFQGSQGNTFTEEEVRAYAEKIKREYEEKLRQERAKNAAQSTRSQSNKTNQEPSKQQTTKKPNYKINSQSKAPKSTGNSGLIFLGILFFLVLIVAISSGGFSKSEEDKVAEMKEAIQLFQSDKYDESFAILSQYAEEDFFTDEAYYCLAYMHGEGLGTSENDKTANDMMTVLSEWEDSNFSKWANNYLGHQYYDGEGTAVNRVKAYEKFISAARNGVPYAMFKTAQLYHYGEGTPKDLEKAEHWYKKASENNITDANKALKGQDFIKTYTKNTQKTSSPKYYNGQNIRSTESIALWDKLDNSVSVGTVSKGDWVEIINTETEDRHFYYVKWNGKYGYLNTLALP